MNAPEALEVALAKEKAAIELYKGLSMNHPEIRELLVFLADEERKHKKMIEGKLAEFNQY